MKSRSHSDSLATLLNFLWLNILHKFLLLWLNILLKFFVADPYPGSFRPWIRNPGWKNSDSGSVINILDPQHCIQGIMYGTSMQDCGAGPHRSALFLEAESGRIRIQVKIKEL
jgi:hypothetical protein